MNRISTEIAEKADELKMVRIFVFDQIQWRSDYPQFFHINPAALHFSIGEYICIENDRSIPQQAVSTLTNIDDIESYIRKMENKTSYLYAIDMPVRERNKVMQELSFMGITAGSLFPGLDGTCEELKERNFNH